MLMVTKLIHLAVFPNVNAGIRKSVRSRSGNRARCSHQTNKTRTTIPLRNSMPTREFLQVPFCAVASASSSKEILNAKVIVPGKSKGSFLSAEPLKLSGGSK
jgi:hypothetical protein